MVYRHGLWFFSRFPFCGCASVASRATAYGASTRVSTSIKLPAMKLLIIYLAQLRAGKIALWCYLIWYLVMAMFYFDPRPARWINSVGISVVIGTALILSVLPPAGVRVMEKWALARLFMMPFCVSSFAALIKERGFFVVFSPSLRDNLIAIGACALFVIIVVVVKYVKRTV